MFKYVALICLLVAVCSAAPQQNPAEVQVLKYDKDVAPDGYTFELEQSDGTSRQEKASLENPDAENASINVEGSYSFVAPDGKQYTVTFTAGENGFQPHTSVSEK